MVRQKNYYYALSLVSFFVFCRVQRPMVINLVLVTVADSTSDASSDDVEQPVIINMLSVIADKVGSNFMSTILLVIVFNPREILFHI